MQKLFFILGAALLLLAALPAFASGEWEELRGCRLIKHEANDGDSFHVKADGEERISRRYFVDAPESERAGQVANRISDQAETFGITEKESIEIGKKAAAFTRSVLSRPFAVLKRGQNAMGPSQLKREYAFVTTADGEDLGEMLVSQGLARSHSEDAATPNSKADDLRDRYDAFEAKARSEKTGAWGGGASVPTMALPRRDNGDDAEVRPFVGIGAVLSREDGYPKVGELIPDGPADLAGELKKSDRIAGVAQGDGAFEVTVEMSLDQVVERIRGEKGSTVRLQVIAAGLPKSSAPKVISIVRDEVLVKAQQANSRIISFGDVAIVSIGTTEKEFVRAYPQAERGEDGYDATQRLHSYFLTPPDSLDADKVTFVFAQGRLLQMNHDYGKERLKERGGWHADYKGLSQIFGAAGKPYAVDPLAPKTKHAFSWKSEVTGEAASLDVYPDDSSTVTFYMSSQRSSRGTGTEASANADSMPSASKDDFDYVNSIMRLPERVEPLATPEPEQVATRPESKLVSFGSHSEVLYQRDKNDSNRLRLDAPEDTVAKVVDYRTGRVMVIAWIAKNSMESRLWVSVPDGLYKIVYAQQVHETTDGEFYAGYYGKLRDPIEVRYEPISSVDLSINDTEYPNVKSSAKEFGSFRPPR